MLQILSPSLLFNREKIFRIQGNAHAKTINNASYRIVLIYEAKTQELPQNLKEMADKLVVACQFKLPQALYINRSLAADVSISAIQNQYSPEAIIVFGDFNISRNMAALKKNLPYDLNGIKVICTDNLSDLEKVKGAKATLWDSLKKMLALK